jgi:membrane-associated phospholipid phosphatase
VREKSTGRFRPFGGQGSFPSTHAAGSFAVATVFAERYDWPVGLVAYGLAAAISASRVYSDAHFTSDVVAGALIGWGIGHFLNNRHPVDSTEWQIRPTVMEHGLGAGLVVGTHF